MTTAKKEVLEPEVMPKAATDGYTPRPADSDPRDYWPSREEQVQPQHSTALLDKPLEWWHRFADTGSGIGNVLWPAAAVGALGYAAGRGPVSWWQGLGTADRGSRRWGRNIGLSAAAVAALPGLLNMIYNIQDRRGGSAVHDNLSWLQSLNLTPQRRDMLKSNAYGASLHGSGAIGARPHTYLHSGRSFGVVPPGVAKSYAMREIDSDPYLSPQEKARLLRITAAAGSGPTGIIGWQDIARGATSAGVGYVGASVIGKTMDAMFGLKPSSYKKLQHAGIAAGVLKGLANLGR